MAATNTATAIVCTGTTVITTPVRVHGVKNDSTASFTITKGANTIFSGGAGTGQFTNVQFRSASGVTVTVTGGGSVTLYLAVK